MTSPTPPDSPETHPDRPRPAQGSDKGGNHAPAAGSTASTNGNGSSRSVGLSRADVVATALDHGGGVLNYRAVGGHDRNGNGYGNELGTFARTAESMLATASRLCEELAPLNDQTDIAQAAVSALYDDFELLIAAILRLDESSRRLRLVAATGRLVDEYRRAGRPVAWEQSIEEGVNGRVARTGEPALLVDTDSDPDFIFVPGALRARSAVAVPIRVEGRVWGVLDLESAETGAFGKADLLLAETVASQVGAALHYAELFERFERTLTSTIAVLCDALEAKDPYTAEHARDVADLAEAVGEELGIRGDEMRWLRYAALLHDVGKIGIREEILRKPGRLTEEEFEEMKKHSEIGARMLERIPGFGPVLILVRAAHERWDGRGYPDGLVGEDIPLGARVIAVCDAFHAMTSDRPYRKALSDEEAKAEMRRCAGSQFDPRVVDALLAVLEREAVAGSTL